ncbi:hypothetical protein FlaCF_1972 [Flavobacterium tructae]
MNEKFNVMNDVFSSVNEKPIKKIVALLFI